MKILKGYNSIFSYYYCSNYQTDYCFQKPHEVYINSEKQKYVQTNYQFNETISEVKLVFNTNINEVTIIQKCAILCFTHVIKLLKWI